MIAKTPWLERRFDLNLPVSAAPLVLERLRGTPARLEDRVSKLEGQVLAKRLGETWSILEIIGHLMQVEDLWAGRLDDYLAGEAVLRPAGFETGKVERAGFDQRPARGLLYDYRIRRAELVRRLEALDAAAIAGTAMHPRLNQPMRLLDLMIFAAEHDDHHLARIGEIARETALATPAIARGAAAQVIASGPRVLLRDRDPADVENYVRWQTTGEWREYDAPWEQGPPLETEEQKAGLRRRFLHVCAEPAPHFRESALISTTEGRALGWLNRYGGGASPSACKVGIDICEDEFLNRGLGTEALSLWIDYLFSNPALHRIGLDTWSFNQRMARVARRVGFAPEGAEREQVRWRDEWLDLLHFGLLRREWDARRRD
jgi:RimJ/RimL family protein N-acetyltransferase/uncharacterized damage-inducible protein DinB